MRGNGGKAEGAPEDPIPSSVLEKGIIFFYLSPHVDPQDPQSIDDDARSHIVLWPLPLDAKLDSGPLPDHNNSRLLTIPQTELLSGSQDRLLSFVEITGAGINQLLDRFRGTWYQPARPPSAEGFYALTARGASHLAYIITHHSITEEQNILGLALKGSFITAVKNPMVSSPENSNLSTRAKYPAEIIERFRGSRWKPVEPNVLEYLHTQILLIGKRKERVGRAVQGQERGGENRGDEDWESVQGLDENDPVFAYLARFGVRG